MSDALQLSDLWRCFQGIIPSIIATADARGVPNITYLSQVYYVDEHHVALSCQFFNKTRRNLDQNPHAAVEVLDPATFQAYRLRLRFLRSDKSGPLFDTMALRIDAIAAHTGMKGVFRLIASDVFEVESVEMVEGFLQSAAAEAATASASIEGLRTELRGLQLVSDRINRARDLESLLDVVLEALDQYFGFSHTFVLLNEEGSERLVTLGSRGFGRSGVGAEVAIGEGLLGTVARERRVLRLSTVEADLRYGRAIRREAGREAALAAEIPLPGLPDAQSLLAIPLLIGDRLVGVLAAQDRDPMRFGEWHEAYLEIIGNQIALGIDRMMERSDEPELQPASSRAAQPAATIQAAASPPAPSSRSRRLTYYRNDDAIFVDDEYLIRSVPARILWKVLGEARRSGRVDFSNRELRLDPALGLPPVKDNLESRLILLRHRLAEKCPDVQLVPTARGRFSLRAQVRLELSER